MSSSLRWPDAALAGLASSMRTTAGPAALAVRGRISGRARILTLIAAAGELAVDKTPLVPDRVGPPSLGGRIAAGAYTGRAVAGPAGIAVGAASAAIGSFATFRARGLATERTGLPDPVVAVAEDAVALGAALLATRSPGAPDAIPEEQPGGQESPPPSVLRAAARGALIGVIATATMTLAQGAQFALTGAQPSDAPVTVADKLKRRIGAGRISRRRRPPVNQAMHWLYGSSWGIPFGIATARVSAPPELIGPAFGLLVWGAGLAVQPAVGVADPPWERSAASLGSEALFHLAYGIGAGGALRALSR